MSYPQPGTWGQDDEAGTQISFIHLGSYLHASLKLLGFVTSLLSFNLEPWNSWTSQRWIFTPMGRNDDYDDGGDGDVDDESSRPQLTSSNLLFEALQTISGLI